ncbi:flagellar biosynthesis anti-sigma factor FlgM [Erythrobacter donghaensis]|jgi:negative regulator of flagellin synthesis FlgM|uniref:flagellar biosynthesis anti-sigma factor FlgM n=1 Tax=Erythrobacter donghaensis TaxID=267135 RepID=UPI00093F2192|nr:flagellar biosynthesis anti-sigma factor FlgM [Erythrobacter donghaensis]
MSSVEPSKVPAVGAARAVAAGERAQIEARPRPAAAASGSAAASGVSLEVSAPVEAAAPPVDAERVKQIKAALADGSYPLVPTKIADAMIAAQVSLSLPERN